MKGFTRHISPKGAVTDLAAYWQKETPFRWPLLALSVTATLTIFMLFVPASQRADLPRPEITYIATLAPDRTDAEIIAANCANEERKQELEARIAENEEARRELYQALGRATFVDVDEAVAKADAQREAERIAAGAPTPEERAEQDARAVEQYCATVAADAANAG